ncbi:MAG: prephenate dehydrogenase/arogenate dehydrogenase family protein [Planctomycetaceae bacterium]
MGDSIGTSDTKGTLGNGTLGIAGVGLIGSSIAAAVKSRRLFRRIIGFGRSVERLEAARQAGLIDDLFVDDDSACRDVDLFVSCLPVDRIVDSVRGAASCMKPGSVITDAGSVKGTICEALGPEPAPGVTFVGSHPLAGSEKQGFENADANLFLDRVCVMTPTGAEPASAVDRVHAFWRGLGSEVVTLSPAEHDAVLARTSHVPHLVAAALCSVPTDEELRFAAGGFRDTTRIAAGDPDLWTAVVSANRGAIEDALALFIAQCEQCREAIAAGDESAVRRFLITAKARRNQFTAVFNNAMP